MLYPLSHGRLVQALWACYLEKYKDMDRLETTFEARMTLTPHLRSSLLVFVVDTVEGNR